jgi:hypoxanthine phosphoribosyltransferase
MNKNKNDVNGKHYSLLGISPFEYSFANGFDCYQHTAVKYVTRHKDKGGLADIDKAIQTLKLYKAALQGAKANAVTSINENEPEIEALHKLIDNIKVADNDDILVVVSTGRGGAWAAAQIAYALNVPCIVSATVHSFKDIDTAHALFVDDICDMGFTICRVKEAYPDMRTAVLFNRAANYVKGKKTAQPDYVGQMIHHSNYVEMPISQYADLNKQQQTTK